MKHGEKAHLEAGRVQGQHPCPAFSTLKERKKGKISFCKQSYPPDKLACRTIPWAPEMTILLLSHPCAHFHATLIQRDVHVHLGHQTARQDTLMGLHISILGFSL